MNKKRKVKLPTEVEQQGVTTVGVAIHVKADQSKRKAFVVSVHRPSERVPANFGQADCECKHCKMETLKALMTPEMLKPQILDEFKPGVG